MSCHTRSLGRDCHLPLFVVGLNLLEISPRDVDKRYRRYCAASNGCKSLGDMGYSFVEPRCVVSSSPSHRTNMPQHWIFGQLTDRVLGRGMLVGGSKEAPGY